MKNDSSKMRLGAGRAAAVMMLLLAQSLVSRAMAADDTYVGAEKCKSCHAAATKGGAYTVWAASKHHEAFTVLASDDAKKLAAAKGIADPQKADACLKCHETAFGVPDAQKGKKFDPTAGVECETCHGPSSNHVKARLAAEDTPEDKFVDTKAEHTEHPGPATCVKCHNADSPNFKGFNFREMFKKIAHLDPRNPRPADYLDKLPEK